MGLLSRFRPATTMPTIDTDEWRAFFNLGDDLALIDVTEDDHGWKGVVVRREYGDAEAYWADPHYQDVWGWTHNADRFAAKVRAAAERRRRLPHGKVAFL